MKRQIILSALIGGIIGSIVVVIVLLVLNQSVPLKTQDLLTFIVLVVSMVIAAFTILGASTLFTSWNDIDERSEKVYRKYEERAEKNIEKYGLETKQEIVKDVNERQTALTNLSRQYVDELAQRSKKAQQGLRGTFFLSIGLIGLVAAVTYLSERIQKWKKP